MAPVIGCAILTCNRESYVSSLLNSLDKDKLHEIVIIDDSGNDVNVRGSYGKTTCIYNEKNIGVGKSKNIALRYLVGQGCTDIFLLEDDIVIKDNSVFEKYITASRVTGIQHFNFAFHGDDNYNQDRSPAIKLKVEYSNDVAVCFYPNVYGAFSYYTRECLEKCGYMDEYFYNALEHVDHTYKIIQKQMHPPFRWFADIENSEKYISEQDSSHSGSTIRKDQSWVSNFHKMADYFALHNKFDVRDPHAKVATKDEVINSLKHIKKTWKK